MTGLLAIQKRWRGWCRMPSQQLQSWWSFFLGSRWRSAIASPRRSTRGIAGSGWLIALILGACMLGWLYYHFLVKRSSLDLNSLNTIFLMLCFLLHGNIRNLSRALQRAVVSCWPILVLYHLYAGVAGLIQFTTIGEAAGGMIAPISTRWTFPLLTAIAGTIVATFVPSSGGQWVIQGFLTIKAAEAAGVTAQRGMLALGVGDQMGNLVAPFWFLVRAEIARIDFRTFFGYGLIFALLWFVFGVAAFTFLPC